MKLLSTILLCFGMVTVAIAAEPAKPASAPETKKSALIK